MSNARMARPESLLADPGDAGAPTVWILVSGYGVFGYVSFSTFGMFREETLAGIVLPWF